MLGHFLTPKSSQVCSNFVKFMRDFRFTLPGVSNDLERMSFELKIRTPAEDFLTFTVDIGRPLFILGGERIGKVELDARSVPEPCRSSHLYNRSSPNLV